MENNSGSNKYIQDFKRRISEVKTTRWIRFVCVAIIFFAWVVWLRNPWVALWIILLFDIYITGYIPLTWWKKSKNAMVKTIMSWVDAIVYAIVLVYFVFAFVGQNYQIPSSSLEKTLLTGDYLWVNKMVYGPRVPMTPVHFPLVHNTMPILNCNSYLDNPAFEYHRLEGLRKVESGDIVVFNFPAGDTVSTRFEESPEYYDVLVRAYGRERLHSDKETFGDIIYRPVDRRQNFVKRCVGLPGERLKIVNDTIYINGEAQPLPENVQFNYIMAAASPLTEEVMHELEITPSDVEFINPQNFNRDAFSAILPKSDDKSLFYALPLTQGMIKELSERGILQDCIKINQYADTSSQSDYLYPNGDAKGWTLSNYGGKDGLWIPKKGSAIKLSPRAWSLYHRVIRNYEGHTNSYLKDGVVYIDGEPAEYYTFAMDYYFMMGDNRDNSQDSRYWGFVPEDHIVGTPMIVLISFDRDRSMFNGGIRWNRILRDANPDK